MENAIEKTVEIQAPLARVWRAVTDYREFGEWFRVALERPFVVGEVSSGFITWPGYEHVRWTATIVAIERRSGLRLRGCRMRSTRRWTTPARRRRWWSFCWSL